MTDHNQLIIRRLTPEDAESSVHLRREALREDPSAFASSPEDDRASHLDFTRKSLAAENEKVITFGAFWDDLVGTIGLLRWRQKKLRHKIYVIGFYVTPAHRNRGIGRALLDAVIEYSSQLDGIEQILLTVCAPNDAALSLYTKMGFSVWGTEPNALKIDGVSVTDIHMILQLS